MVALQYCTMMCMRMWYSIYSYPHPAPAAGGYSTRPACRPAPGRARVRGYRVIQYGYRYRVPGYCTRVLILYRVLCSTSTTVPLPGTRVPGYRVGSHRSLASVEIGYPGTVPGNEAQNKENQVSRTERTLPTIIYLFSTPRSRSI